MSAWPSPNEGTVCTDGFYPNSISIQLVGGDNVCNATAAIITNLEQFQTTINHTIAVGENVQVLASDGIQNTFRNFAYDGNGYMTASSQCNTCL
jgi:hypothetical protein